MQRQIFLFATQNVYTAQSLDTHYHIRLFLPLAKSKCHEDTALFNRSKENEEEKGTAWVGQRFQCPCRLCRTFRLNRLRKGEQIVAS